MTASWRLDESGVCDRDLLRTHQRALRGHRTTRFVPRVRDKRFALIRAIGLEGLLALEVLDGTVNRKVFERFLRDKLVCNVDYLPLISGH